MDYWQKRQDRGELSLCTVDIHFHDGNIGFGRSYRGKTADEMFDLLKSLDGQLDKSVDIKTFYPTINTGYTIEFKDGSEYGLGSKDSVVFTFYYDCEYVVASGYSAIDSKIYKVANPDLLRSLLAEKGFYISPETQEVLKEKTISFLTKNDSLSKITDVCSNILLRQPDSDSARYIESVPTADDDFTFMTDGRYCSAYPTRLVSINDAAYAAGTYCTTVFVPVDGQTIRFDLLYGQNEDEDYIINAVIITKDIPAT